VGFSRIGRRTRRVPASKRAVLGCQSEHARDGCACQPDPNARSWPRVAEVQLESQSRSQRGPANGPRAQSVARDESPTRERGLDLVEARPPELTSAAQSEPPSGKESQAGALASGGRGSRRLPPWNPLSHHSLLPVLVLSSTAQLSLVGRTPSDRPPSPTPPSPPRSSRNREPDRTTATTSLGLHAGL